MVKGKITHHSLFRVCVFFHIKLIIFIVTALLLIISISTGFSAEQTPFDDKSLLLDNESIYFIADRSHSVLKFGVSIIPDHFTQPTDSALNFSSVNPCGVNYQEPQHANASTVVRIVLDEFKCFSGLNNMVQGVEKSIDGYTRKFMITGEFNLDPKNTEPVNYIEKINFEAQIYKKPQKDRVSHRKGLRSILSQFEINKLTWNMGFYLNSPGLSLKLGIGDAFIIHSSTDKNIIAGVMVKLSI